MPRVSIARLFDDNRDKLKLSWLAGREGAGNELDSEQINFSTQGLIGHLNFIHPNWIQVLGVSELGYLNNLGDAARHDALMQMARSGPVCFIVSGDEEPPPALSEVADITGIPLLSSPLPSLHLMWVLRYYLARGLAESLTLHGVFLDVLGMGVLITGESGVGKSELALELISRGNGLVADDVVELYRIAPEILEGRCPPLLKDFLEVRGLGVLNIRSIFGETAVRLKKNLKLIVNLVKPAGGNLVGMERLPLNASAQEIMEISVRKVSIPVAAGRNLAVLVEAAVRNYVLQLRGIDSTQEFINRHEAHLNSGKE